ncbi:LacI family DNA-binding transcriptional regulator [Nesterenkonia alba]|uniref:LacI family DNA-binding transcriptional regulator n=1 Tax=Nesterenkonia alba TaxID=515814 RepID=UPI0003B4A27F|nr:LacI family DNA-binding transcriptional regulator [Nesterenkonia alba]
MSNYRIRLNDVARLAGVSPASASKALNDRPGISEATRLRVKQAARDLAFVGNPAARGLSEGRTGIVGLLTSDLEGRFSLPILMGAEDALGADRLSVILCDGRGDPIREQRHLETLLSRRVDGLLVVGTYNDPRPSLGDALPVPTVYVHAPSMAETDRSVLPDNVAAGRMAAEHLLSLGKRRIAHISGQGWQRAAQDRAEGLLDTLRAQDLSLVWTTNYGEWTERWGRSAMQQLLNSDIEVDAVICDSDQIARGAMDALILADISVPEDVAIMGFDNWEVVVNATDPGLTSIDMNLEALGRHAASLLFHLDADQTPPPPRLVARGSTVLGA